jgi:signal peptidase I
MLPTLQPGERFIVEFVSPDFPARVPHDVGDVVVFHPPGNTAELYVHRMVAKGGDRIDTSGADVLINGKALPRQVLCTRRAEDDDWREDTISSETNNGRRYATTNHEEPVLAAVEGFDVPEGDFYVMGDARDNANDSRVQGPIPDAHFAGRVLYILWSSDWRRIGRSLTGDVPVAREDYCAAGAK